MQLKDQVHRSSCAVAAPSTVFIGNEDLGRAFWLIKKKKGGKSPVNKEKIYWDLILMHTWKIKHKKGYAIPSQKSGKAT